MIIADTNVVSEFMRDEPAPVVMSWAEAIGPSDLALCVVTVQEIEHGLRRMPAGRRQRDLMTRWDRLIEQFADAIIPYDLGAAHECARILSLTEAAGRTMSLADAQIAAICLAAGRSLATRNVTDFDAVPGLTVINPFHEASA